MKERGIIDSGLLPGYHFRDDALTLWDRTERFTEKVLNAFYASDQVRCKLWFRFLVFAYYNVAGSTGRSRTAIFHP